MTTAADVFVRCLENEGVRHVFGIPGEETLDLNEALDGSSSIQFVPVRHEQGGAFMADAYGRLTGQAGVCLGTLGPGATNLVTGLADASLDRAPVVALTGQTGLAEMHKESHQYIDIVRMMKPVTKWNARIHDPEIIPEAMTKLRERQGRDSYAANKAALETPFASAWAGAEHGDVTLVMFTDYACGYCRASLPAIAALLEKDANVRMVYREYPILSDVTVTAARWALGPGMSVVPVVQLR